MSSVQSFASPRPTSWEPPPAGQYTYGVSLPQTNSVVVDLGTNKLWGIPMCTPVAFSIDQLSFNITAVAAGTLVTLGIYSKRAEPNATFGPQWGPDKLFIQTAEVDLNAGGIARYLVALPSVYNLSPGIFFIVIHSKLTGASIAESGAMSLNLMGERKSGNNAWSSQSMSLTSTYSSTLPATFPAGGVPSLADQPGVQVRVS